MSFFLVFVAPPCAFARASAAAARAARCSRRSSGDKLSSCCGAGVVASSRSMDDVKGVVVARGSSPAPNRWPYRRRRNHIISNALENNYGKRGDQLLVRGTYLTLKGAPSCTFFSAATAVTHC